MLTISLVLLLAAFIVTIGAAVTPPRVPLWIAVLLIIVALLVRVLPS